MKTSIKNAASGVWHPIETAPDRRNILVAYDKGQVRLIEAVDNDGDWEAPDPVFLESVRNSRGIKIPTHWMPVPTAPRKVYNHERDCGLTNDAGTCECPQDDAGESK